MVFRLEGERYHTALLGMLALVGVGAVLFATHRGLGIGTESIYYITAARNLLSGYGLSDDISSSGEAVPMVISPPLFPVMLAAIVGFGVELLVAAKWLNAVLFGANILSVGLLIKRYAGKPTGVAVFGSALMLTSVDMLSIHSWAMSEPAFIFFGLLGVLLLDVYFGNREWRLLVAASGAVALAFLTRYVGVTLVAAGIAGIILRRGESWSRRTTEGAIFALGSCIPMGVWGIRNLLLTGHMTDSLI